MFSKSIENIYTKAVRLMKKYDERAPFKLAKAMGIRVSHYPMRHIVINVALSDPMQRIIMAHEIGHVVLHLHLAEMRPFHDFGLCDSSCMWEYEANLFPAEYLLDDAMVLGKLNEENFFFSAAKALMVLPELLDFKFRILKRKGLHIDSLIRDYGNFLRDLRDISVIA